MNKYLGALVVFLLIAVVFVYWQFGAVKNLDYYTDHHDTIRLNGISYEGRPTQRELKEAFNQIQAEAGRRNIPFYVVTYPSEENLVRQFLGLDGVPAREGWDSREIPEAEDVRVILDVSPVWMPSPEKVWDGARQVAASEGRSLKDYSIEIYRPDQPIEVWFPLRSAGD